MPAAGVPVRSESVASSADHPAYRRDIDGLRAVAVLSVIGFHAFASYFPGGFVGVDIFFVISGYLITTIILGDLRKDAFSYRTFYTRRIKRIFPALVVVLTTVWLLGWLRLFPGEYRQLGEHVAAGATFVSNFVLRTESGYFDNVAESKPLLHLWSLAIEEQFYIFWPLILALAVRHLTSRLATLWTIVAIASLSFVFNLSTLGTVPVFTFFSPFTRFWELMVGGLLAHGMQSRPAWFERFREVRSVSGFVLLFAAIFWLSRGMPYPGWRALLPTIGAFLVISAGPRPRLNRWLLSNRAAVWFGKISYPLYLWHWPLLAFLFIAQTQSTSREVRLGVVAVSIGLAWLTYRFVETPIRSSGNIRSLPLGLLAALLAIGVLGYATYRHEGFVSRLGDRGAYTARFDESTPEMRYRTANGIPEKFHEECNFYDYIAWRAGHSTITARNQIDPSCYRRAAGTTRAVFVWGDSHAEHLNWGLRQILPKDVALLQVASSGCGAALVEPSAPAADYCARSNQFALEIIRKEKPDVVVIAQQGGHQMARFRRIVASLKASGVPHVLVIGPIPQWKPDLDKVIAAHFWPDPPERLKDYLNADIVTLNDKLSRDRRPDDPFVYIDLFDALCNSDGCRIDVDGDWRDALMTFDYGHLTPKASVFVARTILAPPLLNLLGTPPGPRPE